MQRVFSPPLRGSVAPGEKPSEIRNGVQYLIARIRPYTYPLATTPSANPRSHIYI